MTTSTNPTVKAWVNVTSEDGELIERFEVEAEIEPDGYVQFPGLLSQSVSNDVRQAMQVLGVRKMREQK